MGRKWAGGGGELGDPHLEVAALKTIAFLRCIEGTPILGNSQYRDTLDFRRAPAKTSLDLEP